MSTSRKVLYFPKTAMGEMSRLCELCHAISLSDGTPDFGPPSELVETAVLAMRHGSNQYSDSWGQMELREAIARKVKRYNRIDADPDKNVTVTCGVSVALAGTVVGLMNPGDHIRTMDLQ